MPSFYVENFGCRATQADGVAIERGLLERGLSRAARPEEAQVVVLNTCTVTAAADQDARHAIRRIHRNRPQARILVTGCYAQRAPQELALIPGVAWVVGNSHKHQVAAIAAGACGLSNFVPLENLFTPSNGQRPTANDNILVGDIFAHTELLAAPVFDADLDSERTRPNLKVQDGCDNRCSFCVIPYVRGPSRSLPLAEVLRQVQALVAAGYREVVVSGINLGRWGRDFAPPLRFEQLVRAILEHTDLDKLRLSSIEPMDWSDDLIALVALSPRIAKHAHVPMQSASDRVLRRMHRKYRPWHYAEKLRSIRAAMPAAAIGADVMTGFPGETDADFDETRRAVEDLPLTYLHVFTYSPRPGTPAASLPHHVPVAVARHRTRVLRDLAQEKNRRFREQFVGRWLPAITLARTGADQQGDFTETLTDNYLKLRLAGLHQSNQWLAVRIEGLTADALAGRLPNCRTAELPNS